MEFLKIAARFNKSSSSSSSSKQPPLLSSESKSQSESQAEHIPSTSTSSSTTHSHYAEARDAPLTSNNHNDNDRNNNDEDYEEDDDDDDFITNEVKRRLKELRKSSFMVLIPEEEPTPDDDHDHHHRHDDHDDNDDDEDDRSLPADAAFPFGLDALNAWLCGFDALYAKYSERMLFFDRSIAHLLPLPLPLSPNATSRRSPRSPSALASTLRSLSFKRSSSSRDNADDLQPQSTPDPYHTLETAYVAQLSLSWEALHTQYAHLNLKISSSQPDPGISYTRAAQAFQQFQVLLQRFIESEPFQPGSRVHIYTRSRSHLSKLLQVPNYQALDKGNQPRDDDESDLHVAATDLIKVLEESILTFRLFLKKDKTKSGAVLGVQSTAGSSLHQVQASLDKKEMKVKELFKKKKGWKSKAWPGSAEEVELVFALIDIKVVARVLRMAQLSKEQLLWCEEKMSKIDLIQREQAEEGFLSHSLPLLIKNQNVFQLNFENLFRDACHSALLLPSHLNSFNYYAFV